MRTDHYTHSAWRSRLVRGVAVFFVLFVFTDIAFPQLCREAVNGLPLAGHAAASTTDQEPDATQRAAVNVSKDSRDDRQPDKAPHEEDCLGCCAHVLPATEFADVVTAELVSLPPPTEMGRVPMPSLRSPYHPPRLS